MNLIKAGAGHAASSLEKRLLPRIAGGSVVALLVAGIVLGLFHPGRKTGSRLFKDFSQGAGSAHDQLSISSAERVMTAEKGQETSAGPGKTQGPGNGAHKRNELLAQQQRQLAVAQQAAAQQAAAQQAAQESALAEKNRELEQKAVEQAAKEKQLEQDQLRVAADQQRAAAAADRLRQEAIQRQSRPAPYSGPSSGNIVWQGEVHGTTLVTINGSASDSGEVLSGALPGVLVMVQPVDAKHVGVAGTPAPSNSFRRLTLRVQGNGVLQEVIRWSIP